MIPYIMIMNWALKSEEENDSRKLKGKELLFMSWS